MQIANESLRHQKNNKHQNHYKNLPHRQIDTIPAAGAVVSMQQSSHQHPLTNLQAAQPSQESQDFDVQRLSDILSFKKTNKHDPHANATLKLAKFGTHMCVCVRFGKEIKFKSHLEKNVKFQSWPTPPKQPSRIVLKRSRASADFPRFLQHVAKL